MAQVPKVITRVCNDCGETKELADLVKADRCLHGRRKLCKPCSVIRSQKSYDPVKKSKYDKARRKKMGDALRAYDRERSKLPHRRAAHNEETRRRRAKLKEAVPEDFDKEGVKAMYALAQKISEITGIAMHVDHIKPISRGGEHNTRNLQLLEASLNVAKGSSENFQLSWRSYDV